MTPDRKQFIIDVADEIMKKERTCHNCICVEKKKQHQEDHEFISKLREVTGRCDNIWWNMIQLIITIIVLSTLASMGWESIVKYFK